MKVYVEKRGEQRISPKRWPEENWSSQYVCGLCSIGIIYAVVGDLCLSCGAKVSKVIEEKESIAT